MATLDNPRWEKFAQLRASGLPAYRAYGAAGYTCAERDAFSASSVLSRNVKVLARIRELNAELAERMSVTRESIAAEIDQGIALAHQERQPAAVISGAMAKAKLYGMIETPKSGGDTNINMYAQMSDDELLYELASMVNEVRAANAMPLRVLPPRKDDERNDPPGDG